MVTSANVDREAARDGGDGGNGTCDGALATA